MRVLQSVDALTAHALSAVNAIRAEVEENRLDSLPVGARSNPEYNCPIARALTALILPNERRIFFHHPWYAAAATKVWNVRFTDPFLLSVEMPQTIYEFALAFRAGFIPELEEGS